MSDFTIEQFKTIAKEVASHISKKTMRGLTKVGQNDWHYTHDVVWNEKRDYTGKVLSRFIRIFFILGDDGKVWNGEARELIRNMEASPWTCGKKPFFSNDPNDKFNSSSYLMPVFDLFLEKYTPPDDQDRLLEHLRALQLYYSEIGYHLDCDPAAAMRIDFAMTLATGAALEKIGEKKCMAVREFDRTTNSTKKRQRSPKRQWAIETYHRISPELRKKKPYKLAKTIKDRWNKDNWKTGTKPPSRRSIVNWLRKEKLIPQH